jgi:hypothetical protein
MMVKLSLPDQVDVAQIGAPEMRPVVAFSVRPLGKNDANFNSKR